MNPAVNEVSPLEVQLERFSLARRASILPTFEAVNNPQERLMLPTPTLMSIPQEIRDRIYSKLLPSGTIIFPNINPPTTPLQT